MFVPASPQCPYMNGSEPRRYAERNDQSCHTSRSAARLVCGERKRKDALRNGFCDGYHIIRSIMNAYIYDWYFRMRVQHSPPWTTNFPL